MATITNKQLKFQLEGIRIEISNMVEEEKQQRELSPEHYNETDQARLKELAYLNRKLTRILNRFPKV